MQKGLGSLGTLDGVPTVKRRLWLQPSLPSQGQFVTKKLKDIEVGIAGPVVKACTPTDDLVVSWPLRHQKEYAVLTSRTCSTITDLMSKN